MADNAEEVKKETAPEKNNPSRFGRMQAWWYREFRRIIGAWVFVLVVICVGALTLGALDFTDYVFSRNTFCGNVCHVMESTVYQELQTSKHWNTPTGVRPTCAKCHVAGRLTFAMIDHFLGTGELFVNLTHDFSKPGSFEKFRPDAANRERFKMLENNSETCRSCHIMEAIKPKRVRGQNAHADAMKKNVPCIACHYNLVHKQVEPSEGFLNAIADYLGQPEAQGTESTTTDESGNKPAEESKPAGGGDEVL